VAPSRDPIPMHSHASREWAARMAAWGVGVVATPSPRVISLASKSRAAWYEWPLFVSVIDRLSRVLPPIHSVGYWLSYADATVRLGCFWPGCWALEKRSGFVGGPSDGGTSGYLPVEYLSPDWYLLGQEHSA
jgi:hypothetical protein